MSANPKSPYHYPPHARLYDVESTRLPGGEVDSLMDAFDELLYPTENTVIRAHSALATDEIFITYFSHQFHRLDLKSWIWPIESVTVNAEYTRYLGSSALKQCYKLQIDSEIHRPDLGPNRISTMYYLEQFAGKGQAFFGTIIRPNIIQEDTPKDEQMTVYDCQRLYEDIADIVGLASVDARSRTSA